MAIQYMTQPGGRSGLALLPVRRIVGNMGLLEASIFFSLIFSAHIYHVTMAGSLGGQFKFDNQSINQSNVLGDQGC